MKTKKELLEPKLRDPQVLLFMFSIKSVLNIKNDIIHDGFYPPHINPVLFGSSTNTIKKLMRSASDLSKAHLKLILKYSIQFSCY